MVSDLPLVSCIMPTRNRTRFLARAIDCFLAQDYPNKQLVIWEEESRSLPDVLPYQIPSEILYAQWAEKVSTSIGNKRNQMCAGVGIYNKCTQCATDLIAHWDDDDWHAPNRLSTQIAKMRAEGSRLCGADRLVFYKAAKSSMTFGDGDGERAWIFKTVRKPWLAGGTLIYERSLWQEQPFIEVSDGEDVAFVDAAYKRGVKVSVIEDPSLYVAQIHATNTTKRNIDAQWSSFDVAMVHEWIGVWHRSSASESTSESIPASTPAPIAEINHART